MKSGLVVTENIIMIREILEKSKTIAIIGLSPKAERDSNMVAIYLKKQGYKIIPVHPAQKEIIGEKAYVSLDDINEQVDIVNVFRSSDQILPHAHEALRLQPKVFWMQLNIENEEASKLLTASGIDVVANKCIKVEHARIYK